MSGRICGARKAAKWVTLLVFGAAGLADVAVGEDWPQWRGPKRDGVWRETGIVKQFATKELKPRWRTPIGGGYTGPAVAKGRVYVTDRQRKAKTERVVCLDEATGKIVWAHVYPCDYRGVSYDAGPRCTPTVADGKVYAVGAKGNLFCLDAADGKVIWQKDYVKDFGTKIPIWGIASAPLVDGDRLIAVVGGSEGRTVMALHKDTGAEIWRSLSIVDIGYCPPVIFQAGGVRQLIVWLPEWLVSLDPETGEVYWQQAFHCYTNLSIATPIFDGEKLFVSTFYDGPLMMQMAADRPAASVLWKGKSHSELDTDKLHCLMSTPVLEDGYVYGVCSYGAFRCLDAQTGGRVWATYEPTGQDRWWNAFLIPHEDRYFLPNEQGELVIAKLSPEGYREISRAKLIEPTNRVRRRDIVWSHPAFANKCVYARNDKEILCVSLAAQ